MATRMDLKALSFRKWKGTGSERNFRPGGGGGPGASGGAAGPAKGEADLRTLLWSSIG